MYSSHIFLLHLQVCELHFRLSEIERETSHYVESTGKLLTAPLAHPRLIKGKCYIVLSCF